VLLALILTAALALIGAGQVTTSQARQMASHECGSPVTIRSAPWTMGIQDSIGVRVKHGTTYFLRAGDSGPPCGVARKKLAHLEQALVAVEKDMHQFITGWKPHENRADCDQWETGLEDKGQRAVT